MAAASREVRSGQRECPASCRLISLTGLRAGQSGRVGDVVGPGELVQRLREIGLRDGAEVEMVRPGSPCIIRLDGRKFCFRSGDVAHVMVHA